MNKTVITKKLKNGNRLVIININGIFEYAPKYSELRETIKQLKEIYGEKEVNYELNLEQNNKTNVDYQDENEKIYIKELIKEKIENMMMVVKEKGILYDFSRSPVFDYD